MAGKFSRTFYCIMEPNICVLISTKGILSHSIVYIHVRAPEYISVITFLFKLHLNFDWFYREDILAKIFPHFIMIFIAGVIDLFVEFAVCGGIS